MIVVALPYLITEVLSFEETRANTLYGFAQGALAGGGLAGACVQVYSEKSWRSKSRQSADRLRLICISHEFHFTADSIWNDKLYDYCIMLFCGYGVFNCFFCTDDVIYTDGDAEKFSRKGDCGHDHCFYMRPAIRQCTLRYFVWIGKRGGICRHFILRNCLFVYCYENKEHICPTLIICKIFASFRSLCENQK